MREAGPLEASVVAGLVSGEDVRAADKERRDELQVFEGAVWDGRGGNERAAVGLAHAGRDGLSGLGDGNGRER